MRASHQSWRACRAPTPRRCSSRRARRGRRRSSCSVRSRAASGCRIAPCLPVEPRVLLEVGDLVARRLRHVAPSADERPRLDRRLVGVDLVAEQQQTVGPCARTRPADGATATTAHRCRTLGVLARRQGVGRALGIADAARAEDQARVALVLRVWIVRGRPAVVRRPDGLAIEARPCTAGPSPPRDPRARRARSGVLRPRTSRCRASSTETSHARSVSTQMVACVLPV